jgi:cellulose synthase/poly-beta-1,6-N-acetylglucosamine synthase-like glycosyltransferase
VSWYWFFAVPALALALLSLRGERGRAAYVARRLSEGSRFVPPASVIVPVKGPDEGLRENLAALASLEYPDYELLIAARCARDIPPGTLPCRAKIVLAHGAEDPATGEKVQNLVAAVRAARVRSEVFAFADSDVRVAAGWLRALTAPLAEPGVGAATGYRWFLPQPARFWSLLRGVWDAAVLGMMAPGDSRIAWGGSMAILKETFFAVHVLERWRNTVSDDYALAAAVRSAGLRIAFAPGALSCSREQTGARQLFSWTRRQALLTRIYDRPLWLAALTAHAVYCAGMAASAAVAISGNGIAAAALAAQLIPGMVKGFNRALTAKSALPEFRQWFRRYAWVHAALVPFATWLWLVALLAAAFGNAIEWRGRRYELRGGFSARARIDAG